MIKKKRFLKCFFILLLLGCVIHYQHDPSLITADPPQTVTAAGNQNTGAEQPAATPPSSKDISTPSAPAYLQDGTYSGSISSKLGELVYYNQHDTRWAQYLWGGTDPLTTYGCGPTTLAMIITSFTEHKVTPMDISDWAANNNYHSPGQGSHHNLIPEGLIAYGLEVQSQYVLTPESILSTLDFGKILVVLMGPGHFTKGGHFIILTGTTPDGLVTIVDPQSLDNTLTAWDPALILSEVKNCGYGGPIWAVSTQP